MIKQIFLDFIKQYPKYFIINCILMLLVPINEIGISKLYGRLFESIQNNTFTLNHFYIILFVMIFLQIGYCFQDYFNAVQTTQFSNFCKMLFLRRTFEKYTYNHSLEEPNVTESVDKILRTQHILKNYYSQYFSYFIPICLQLLITLSYFAYIDKYIGLISFVLVFIFLSFIMNSKNVCENDSRDYQMSKLHEGIGDVLNNFISVHKQQTINFEISKLNKIFQNYQKLHISTTKCTIKYRIFLSSIIIISLILFVRRTYALAKMKTLSNSTFYSIFMILANMISNILYMIDLHRNMVFDYGLIKNSGFMLEMNQINYTCNTKQTNKDAILEVNHLYYKYPGKNTYTIQDLSFHVNEGETLAITGHIGSGKSTLLKIILKLKQPNSGDIFVKSKCIHDYNIKEYFTIVSYMPQNCTLFNRSIVDNIIYNNRDITEQHVKYILKKYNLMKHFGQGLDVPSKTLSGGQRQLIWFLRIYFQNPEIIILDEPTASLDLETKQLFVELLGTFFKEKTKIIVTHDHYLLKYVSRVVDIKKINKIK